MPLLQEYPQGYWEGNQFILPTLPPPPQQEVFQAPVAAAPPPVSPLLRARPLLYPYDGGGYMDQMDPTDPMSPVDPTDPNASQSPPGSPTSFSYGTNLGWGGTLLGGIAKAMGAPVFGLGVLGRGIGAAMDVYDAEAALAGKYGAHPPGYPNEPYDPDISWWSAFLPWGEDVNAQVAALDAHMAVAGLEDPAEYQSYTSPSPSAPFTSTYADFGFGFGGTGEDAADADEGGMGME